MCKALAASFKFTHTCAVFVAEATHRVASAEDSVSAWGVLSRVVRRQSSKYPQAASLSGSLEQRCEMRRTISMRKKSGRYVVPPGRGLDHSDDADDDNDNGKDVVNSTFGPGIGKLLIFLLSFFFIYNCFLLLLFRSCKQYQTYV